MLENTLRIDPEARITAAEALGHSYCGPYHDRSDEPEMPFKIEWSLKEDNMSEYSLKIIM
jgi:hypothetical protein